MTTCPWATIRVSWRPPEPALAAVGLVPDLAPLAVGAGPRYASRAFDVSSPCCEVAVTPPSRRALDWSSQYVRDGAWITHTVGLAFDKAGFGCEPEAVVRGLPPGLAVAIPNPLPIGLEALCGNTAITLPVASSFLSSRHTSIWFAFSTDSPCHN